MDTEQSYKVDEAEAEALFGLLEPADETGIMVCPQGHVHVIVGLHQATLSPDQAETWVEALYDAAQEAREVE